VGCNPLGDFILEATLVSVQQIILALALDVIVASCASQVKSMRAREASDDARRAGKSAPLLSADE